MCCNAQWPNQSMLCTLLLHDRWAREAATHGPRSRYKQMPKKSIQVDAQEVDTSRCVLVTMQVEACWKHNARRNELNAMHRLYAAVHEMGYDSLTRIMRTSVFIYAHARTLQLECDNAASSGCTPATRVACAFGSH
eukprot:TRINITY_DN8349_c0_g1_i1.p1 TRINITY_DN8349_c0_g1~~TRINITY_DN8349_c0_g1_i1.p1  ORF type:complete len:136 (-),score=0.29 TRINITY_DN8349_c0_g1_i1:526-933(-)